LSWRHGQEGFYTIDGRMIDNVYSRESSWEGIRRKTMIVGKLFDVKMVCDKETDRQTER